MDRALLDRLASYRPPEAEASEPETGQMVSGLRYWRQGRRVGMVVPDPAVSHMPQTRDGVELIYQCAGAGIYRLNDRDVKLEPGELVLLGQKTLLEIPVQETDVRSVCFFLKPALLADLLQFLGSEETPLHGFILRCLGQETPYGYLHFRVGGVKQVENLMENLMLQFLDHADSRRAVPMHTVGLLFLHLLDQDDRLVIGIREQQSVLRVLQYIEASYVRGSLTEIASVLHHDVAWLSREIRRRTGRTFTELLQERRLTQAAWLLRNTRQKVSDIALSVGYENISYFHRIFGKRFGVSPKKYRDME